MPFCPECKAEYREGFVVCKDCNRPLLDMLPDNETFKNSKHRDKKKDKRDSASIFCMMIAIALMLLPYGIPTGPKDYKTVFYQSFTTSYFHVSYGSNWFPIITAILSILLLVTSTIDYVKGNNHFGKYNLIIVSICIVASPLSWLIYGVEYTITLVGVIVFILHTVTLVLQTKYSDFLNTHLTSL